MTMCDKDKDKDKETSGEYDIKGKENTWSMPETKKGT